jgi:tryptophan-rich sensory protein
VDERGQTGVENISLPFVRFIGISEILGAFGLILPWWLKKFSILTPVSAILFACIMIPAAIIHYERKEPKNVVTNVILFLICLFIAYGRIVLR